MFPGMPPLDPKKLAELQAMLRDPEQVRRFADLGRAALGVKPGETPDPASMRANFEALMSGRKSVPSMPASSKSAKPLMSAEAAGASEASVSKPLDVTALNEKFSDIRELTAESKEIPAWKAALVTIFAGASHTEMKHCYVQATSQNDRRTLRHHLALAHDLHETSGNGFELPELFGEHPLGKLLTPVAIKGKDERPAYLARMDTSAANPSSDSGEGMGAKDGSDGLADAMLDELLGVGKEPDGAAAAEEGDAGVAAESSDDDTDDEDATEASVGADRGPALPAALPSESAGGRPAKALRQRRLAAGLAGYADERGEGVAAHGGDSEAADRIKAMQKMFLAQLGQQSGSAVSGSPMDPAAMADAMRAFQGDSTALLNTARRAGGNTCVQRALCGACCFVTAVFAVGAGFGAWLNSGGPAPVCPSQTPFFTAGDEFDEFAFGPEYDAAAAVPSVEPSSWSWPSFG